VILSYSSLAAAELRPGDRLLEDLEEIRKAGERAAGLTRQLLAFSRQQIIEPQVLDLNDVIGGMHGMLRRLIGDDVQLSLRAADTLDPILADAGQIEQVVMNLAVNARDAMPRGGKLTIETQNVRLDSEYASTHVSVPEGDYVLMAVSDTGAGMDAETKRRIFEPFFTTKEKGKGTGLGLSTVYGIVKQSGGHIWVYSEPGHGTVFKVYLPRHAGTARVRSREDSPVRRLGGNETVLLVENDEQLCSVTREILRKNGYNVLEARNGGEALLTCEQYPGSIHLLLTDVVMPQMSGVQLARRLGETRADMKVLCVSGYADEAVLQHGVIDSKHAFLQKPITPDRLLRKVRQVLDG
jgi:two-component system, cell cycle sensor histidine kinase and response regulator CckA